MAYPRYRQSRQHKHVTKSAGNYTVSSTSYVDLDTTTDIILAAQVGDVLEAHLCAEWSNEAADGILDVATIVSNAVVNHFSGNTTTGNGIPSWKGQASRYDQKGGYFRYTVVAGDINNQSVQLRLRTKVSTGVSKILFANTGSVLQFGVQNIGPVDPN